MHKKQTNQEKAHKISELITIFQGRYTAQNISQGTPLDIFAPVACPNYSRLITEYIFQPNSMDAYAMPVCFITPATPMSAQITINGTSRKELRCILWIPVSTRL